jgi:hypothetical protein
MPSRPKYKNAAKHHAQTDVRNSQRARTHKRRKPGTNRHKRKRPITQRNKRTEPTLTTEGAIRTSDADKQKMTKTAKNLARRRGHNRKPNKQKLQATLTVKNKKRLTTNERNKKTNKNHENAEIVKISRPHVRRRAPRRDTRTAHPPPAPVPRTPRCKLAPEMRIPPLPTRSLPRTPLSDTAATAIALRPRNPPDRLATPNYTRARASLGTTPRSARNRTRTCSPQPS